LKLSSISIKLNDVQRHWGPELGRVMWKEKEEVNRKVCYVRIDMNQWFAENDWDFEPKNILAFDKEKWTKALYREMSQRQ
jgi:hypothetical protein